MGVAHTQNKPILVIESKKAVSPALSVTCEITVPSANTRVEAATDRLTPLPDEL